MLNWFRKQKPGLPVETTNGDKKIALTPLHGFCIIVETTSGEKPLPMTRWSVIVETEDGEKLISVYSWT